MDWGEVDGFHTRTVPDTVVLSIRKLQSIDSSRHRVRVLEMVEKSSRDLVFVLYTIFGWLLRFTDPSRVIPQQTKFSELRDHR